MTFPWIDPRSFIRQQESGLTWRQLLSLARRAKWVTTRIKGRLWISRAEYIDWLQDKVAQEGIKQKAAAK